MTEIIVSVKFIPTHYGVLDSMIKVEVGTDIRIVLQRIAMIKEEGNLLLNDYFIKDHNGLRLDWDTKLYTDTDIRIMPKAVYGGGRPIQLLRTSDYLLPERVDVEAIGINNITYSRMQVTALQDAMEYRKPINKLKRFWTRIKSVNIKIVWD